MRFTLLRAFVAAALLANLLFAAWHVGAFGLIGLAPETQRDPKRLEQQVRPNAVRVLAPAAAASAVAAAAAAAASAAAVGPVQPEPAPTAAADTAAGAASAPPAAASAPAAPLAGGPASPLVCLELGPLEAGALEAVERSLSALVSERALTREQRPAAAQYAVFVGPILSRDAARQRRDELVKLKLSYEGIEITEGRDKVGGYSLGRYDSETAARAALESVRERGLRSARVVVAREAGAPRTWLRMERLSAAQADAVQAASGTWPGGLKPVECLMGQAMSVGVRR
jgi:hypothetical protein